METVQYRGKRGEETHYLYTRDEADELGLPYLEDWRSAERPGQWVLTDDDMVVEVLACGKMRTGTPWLRTPTGSFLASSGTFLDTQPRDSRYTFNGRKVNDQPYRLTERQKQWIILFAHGRDPVTSYMEIFNGSSRRHAERKVFELMKRPEVKERVRSEIKDALRVTGIDERFILETAKGFVLDTEMGDNVRLKCLTLLAEICEMTPDSKETTPLVPVNFREAIAEVEGTAPVTALPTGQEAIPPPEDEGTLEEGFAKEE